MAQEKYRVGTVPPKEADSSRKASSSARKAPLPQSADTKSVPPKSTAKKKAAAPRKSQAELREEREQLAAVRRQRRIRLFRLSFFLSLVFVVLYWCFVALSITMRPRESDSSPRLQVFTAGEKKENQSFEPEEVFFGGVNYLPLTFLEKYMPISEFGDLERRSFMLSDSGEYATFYIGTCNVLVNGQSAAVTGETFLKDDILYIPVDFFTDKMNCFDFTYSSALTCNVLTFHNEQIPAFRFQKPVESNKILITSVPEPPPETLPQNP